MDGHQYTAEFEAPGGKPVLNAYPDPLTKAAPWTIGLGHTGKDVHQDTVWTEPQCWAAFYNDYSTAYAEAAHITGTSCWSALNEQRRAVLADMAFQMGAHGLSEFHHMLTAIRLSDWDTAVLEMKASQYSLDTPNRCNTNAITLKTGEWPEASV